MSDLSGLLDELDTLLAAADDELITRFPGDRGVRQPVHTVYVAADRFHARLGQDWGAQALEVLSEHAGSPAEVAAVFGLSPVTAAAVHERVLAKLGSEPIEDLRVDFEDGLGVRSDDEEDELAGTTARALAQALSGGTAPPFHGVRFKSLEAPTRNRGVRTLHLFVRELVAARGLSGVSDGFVVTLPKVTSVDQVGAMVRVCEHIERSLRLPAGGLRFEIQVETPQSILGPDGTALVARMVHAARGRCTAMHYGTYDYSASCGVAAAYQSMEHPVADHAKAVMQVAAAGTGVHLSDGSTNVLPVGDHASVVAAWRLHARLVRRSLERAFYQGWDLHPAQLPSRFVAVYAFYREGFEAAARRLRAYVERSDSGFLDEPATAVGLAGFLLRAVDCGAVDATEVSEQTGLDVTGLARLARR
ncbi:MAG: DUF6986 family protein [Nocardioidaceae bacterium]